MNTYSYRYDPAVDARTNVSRSMTMDAQRAARLAPTACDLRDRALKHRFDTNGYNRDDTLAIARRLLP